jgi:hypothetical protein
LLLFAGKRVASFFNAQRKQGDSEVVSDGSASSLATPFSTPEKAMPVQKLNQSIRDEIFRRARDAVLQENGTLSGQCLEFAWHGYQLIKTYPGAPRTIIQAGSAQWPRLAPELDDGMCDTHFAYMWSAENLASQLFLTQEGKVALSLPEMHVWLASPDTGELIDFTTGWWPDACLSLLGEPWLAAKPPEYLWDFGTRLPEGVRYVACPKAIALVLALLKQQERPYP